MRRFWQKPEILAAGLIAAAAIWAAARNALHYHSALTALPLGYHIGIPLGVGVALILLELGLVKAVKFLVGNKN